MKVTGARILPAARGHTKNVNTFGLEGNGDIEQCLGLSPVTELGRMDERQDKFGLSCRQ